MLVHEKYLMSQIMQKLNSIEKSSALNLLLPTMFDWFHGRMNGSDDIWLNRQNNEWEWWSMKESAAKICNELNHIKIAIIKWEIMTVLVRKIHTLFCYENWKKNKSRCHLPLYQNVKMNENMNDYLFFILMIGKLRFNE